MRDSSLFPKVGVQNTKQDWKTWEQVKTTWNARSKKHTKSKLHQDHRHKAVLSINHQ